MDRTENWFVFGKDYPKINYAQDPQKGTIVSCENANKLSCKHDEEITWGTVIDQMANLSPDDWREYDDQTRQNWTKFRQEFVRENPQFFKGIMDRFRNLCENDSEKAFFDKFIQWELLAGTDLETELEENLGKPNFDSRKLCEIVQSCERRVETGKWDHGKVLGLPALIPQVWVNWLHHSRRNGERARRARLMPFRVDFLLQCSREFLSPPTELAYRNLPVRKVIIEIDGSSHFATRSTSMRNEPIKTLWMHRRLSRKIHQTSEEGPLA